MPLTGYSRDGYCKTNSGDRGSHNVCVKDLGRGFCEVTGQNDWCGAVDNWCVCELAFDEAVRKLGCDAFTVECDSTNGVVMDDSRKGITYATECIRRQCL